MTNKSDCQTTEVGKFVQCQRWRIHYVVRGQGPALLMLHGAAPGTNGLAAYTRNLDALAQHFTVYAIDFPGWGLSSKNLMPESGEAADPLQLAGQAVVAFMDALDIPKACLLGGSFGGAAALHAAMLCPERVKRLVLIAPAGGISGLPPAPGLVGLLTYYTQEGPTLNKMRHLMHCMVHAPKQLDESTLIERYEASAEPEIVKTFPLRLPATGQWPSMKPLCEDPRLQTLAVPVLLVWGKQDAVQPFPAMASFNALPKRQSLVFDECGHWPHWEYANVFNHAVIDFLVA